MIKEISAAQAWKKTKKAQKSLLVQMQPIFKAIDIATSKGFEQVTVYGEYKYKIHPDDVKFDSDLMFDIIDRLKSLGYSASWHTATEPHSDVRLTISWKGEEDD